MKNLIIFIFYFNFFVQSLNSQLLSGNDEYFSEFEVEPKSVIDLENISNQSLSTQINFNFNNESDVFSTKTTQIVLETTTLTTLDPDEIKINSDSVIVWQKCGKKTRTHKTQILKSINHNKIISLTYDPTINILIYKSDQVKQIIRLPNLVSEIIFFLFNEPNKINIYLDCPGLNKNRFQIVNFDSQIQYFKIDSKANHFSSLSLANNAFKCGTTVSVQPGTIIFLNTILDSSNEISLISFIHDNDKYSLVLQSETIVITTSNEQEIYEILLNQTNLSTGLYLYFTEFSLQFYLNCPQDLNKWSGYWNTTLFEYKLNIKILHEHFYYGNVATSLLLTSFCSSNTLSINNETSLSLVKQNLDLAHDATKFAAVFMPDQYKLKQFDLFNQIISENNPFSFGDLIENEARILFASRDNANARFFHRTLEEYEKGFSDGHLNFWIGLDVLHRVTSKIDFKIRIVATSTKNHDYVEEYSLFKVDSKNNGYSLSIGRLLTCCDGHFKELDEVKFSTYDNGINSELAKYYSAGFWHTSNEKKYCFSCVEKIFSKGSSTRVWLSNGKNVTVLKTKMYLVVSFYLLFLI